MNPNEVVRYLHEHPEFFDQYAELLMLVTIPDPHSGRAISITEKQLFMLREKVRQLEAKLAELISFGEDNDAIAEKVHRMALALLAASDLSGVLCALYAHLGGAFAVPHVMVRLWGRGAGSTQEFVPVDEALREQAAALKLPYCGPAAGQAVVGWFGERGSHIRSLAQMPLRESGRGAEPWGKCYGLLVLGSEEPHRFYPEMGTMYLERIGEMASAALQRVTSA